jgi:hypothetical protein
LDPDLEVPALLYIDRGGKVTTRAIEPTYWIPSLLHGMRNRLNLAIVQIRLSWLALVFALIDRLSPRVLLP